MPGSVADMAAPDRYGSDVLAAPRHPRAPVVPEVEGAPGLVVECATSGWCGEILGWSKTASGWAVRLEDRKGRTRLFDPHPAAFLLEGQLVTLVRPTPGAQGVPGNQGVDVRRTASGSVAGARERAKVARQSRIWVEGRHDAEVVEKVWGDDLRGLGIVVEELGGIDELQVAISEFQPGPGRRLVVLVDHLVAGSKESRIAEAVHRRWAPFVTVLGHPYIDVWQAVKPSVLKIPAWPTVPRGVDWKSGTCQALGWPDDPTAAWRRILGAVRSYKDLDPALLARVEEAIDLVSEAGFD